LRDEARVAASSRDFFDERFMVEVLSEIFQRIKCRSDSLSGTLEDLLHANLKFLIAGVDDRNIL
jgi:hypothetical protein